MSRAQPIVAIDGPAGSGKSTLAKQVAKHFGFVYVDTGALYRAVALLSLRKELQTEADIVAALDATNISFQLVNGENRLFLAEEDITEQIRNEAVSAKASSVSAFSGVREKLLGLQRTLGGAGASVLEGRDIGTVIFPDAEVKIFLTASVEERAKRRALEYEKKGETVLLEEIQAKISQRDEADSSRALAPLKKAEDAIEIDTSALDIATVLDKIIDIVQKRR